MYKLVEAKLIVGFAAIICGDVSPKYPLKLLRMLAPESPN